MLGGGVAIAPPFLSKWVGVHAKTILRESLAPAWHLLRY